MNQKRDIYVELGHQVNMYCTVELGHLDSLVEVLSGGGEQPHGGGSMSERPSPPLPRPDGVPGGSGGDGGAGGPSGGESSGNGSHP